MDRRRTGLAIIAGIGLIAIARAPTPTADIRIETHSMTDLAPHKIQAALDLGVLAVKLLVTWSDTARGG